MKRILWTLLFLVAAGLITLRSLALAQDATTPTQPLHAYYTYGQLKGLTTEQALSGAGAATTIPLWSYSVIATRDAKRCYVSDARFAGAGGEEASPGWEYACLRRTSDARTRSMYK